MSVEVLTVAKAKTGLTKKGYPFRFKETPCTWSSVYKPPNWVIIRVTGATIAQVEHFLETWKKAFVYGIVAQNDNGYRIRVKVDPALVSSSNVNRDLKAELRTYVKDRYNATVHSYEDYEAVLDVPKPIMDGTTEVTLQEVKSDINDVFAEEFAMRHYLFSDTMVANAVTAMDDDEILEVTKAVALADVTNELD